MNRSVVNSKQSLMELLEPVRQTHLLDFWDELSEPEQQHLADQINETDFHQLGQLIASEHADESWNELAARADVPPAITLQQFRDPASYEPAKAAGGQAIAAGKVAMILVAGGQGSRLGFEHPKGMFPIGPVSNHSLYQMIIEKVIARSRQFNNRIPLYVMTSPPTHDESTQFLTDHQFFGMPSDDVQLFCQGVMPAVDDHGKLLLENRNSIFQSPDGHGGTVAALDRNGCLNDMQQRGIEYVFYAQVDNPLVQACDPALIGFHILQQSEMTTQVVRKNEPLQRVGNVVSVDGKVQIIEYSDLPEEFARQTNPDGSLKLWAGSIAVHVFNFDFLKNAAANAESLPFHRAKKKVPFVNEQGEPVTPELPNATKFEKFIFDLLPSARKAIVCELDPAEGFCAVKNAPPAASETPEHVQQAISDLHKSWLVGCGVQVGDDAIVEINPLFAVEPQQLEDKSAALGPITGPTYLA